MRWLVVQHRYLGRTADGRVRELSIIPAMLTVGNDFSLNLASVVQSCGREGSLASQVCASPSREGTVYTQKRGVSCLVILRGQTEPGFPLLESE